MILLSGKCSVINPFDKNKIATLTRGDVFGESDLIRIPVRYSLDLMINRVLIILVILLQMTIK
jgi:hypothetical protein